MPAKKTTAKPAEDFDESTPPPRQRPRGVPAPSYVRLAPGEEAAAHFAAWDKEGRVPAGSFIVRLVGSHGGAWRPRTDPVCESGYRDLQGRPMAPETLEPLRVVSVLVETLKTGASTFAVFA